MMSEFPGSMAANNYREWPEGVKSLVVEPKMDGYRLTAMMHDDGRVTFHCGGKDEPVWAENLNHIRRDLEKMPEFFRGGCMFDGELVANTWNATSSLVRRKRSLMDEETKERCRRELKFYIFDWIPLEETMQADITLPRRRKATKVCRMTAALRRGVLEHVFECPDIGGSQSLILLEQYRVTSEEELRAKCDDLVASGFEGVMAKVDDGLYALGDRCDYWMKMKPVKTVEFVIEGSVEGLGKHVGRLGAFVCRDSKGQSVSVGGGFTDYQREQYWSNRESLVGAEIEVRVEVSDVATARHPIFLRFRADRNVVAAV